MLALVVAEGNSRAGRGGRARQCGHHGGGGGGVRRSGGMAHRQRPHGKARGRTMQKRTRALVLVYILCLNGPPPASKWPHPPLPPPPPSSLSAHSSYIATACLALTMASESALTALASGSRATLSASTCAAALMIYCGR